MSMFRSNNNFMSGKMSGLSPKKNYYIKQQLAYTEDHVLIKNLFLSSISQGLEQQQLRDYFGGFGRVLRLHLFSSGRRIKTKTGYVAFANPRHAAKVLQRKVHYVNEFRFCVQPSDSWHQPDVQKKSHNRGNISPNETPAEIMKLNDHCLEHILSHLSLPDRIHFARTCTRFRNIYEGMSPTLDKSIQFHVFEEMTAWDLRDFFQLSGRHVKQIEGIIPQRHCKRVCNFLGTHCINLQSLRILSNKLTSENTFQMFANLNSLKSLELRGCNLTNQNLQALRQLNQLKKLDLSNNERLTGAHMNCLPDSIESLTLNNCRLKPELINRMLGRLILLKELHTNCIHVSAGIEQIVNEKCCESLEVLSITCSDFGLTEYKHIARLPSLKKLILNIFRDVNAIPPMLMQWLVEHKSMQLEHLEIRTPNCINAETLVDIGKLNALRTLYLPQNDVINDRALEALFTLHNLEEINMKYCMNMTENGVLRLILACPKLQVLHLEGCVRITDKLLNDIISKLQTNHYHRPLPIKINMSGTHDSQLTIPNGDVDAKNIINVSYTVPSAFDADFFHIFNLDDDDDDFDSYDSDFSYDSETDYYGNFWSDEEFEDDRGDFDDLYDLGFNFD
ncbi:uncharacterized protein LOC117785962 [Drosophila innubila]|uniref:uncharacterized protein LOC117785962 n=1 Tax=Drosophila innubila TaxID=198719 RepID=UPI00148CCF46|nr:uncharacterized protein LOC117785962 [Drosophila innubila]